MLRTLTLTTLLIMPIGACLAGGADVMKVDVSCSGETCRFSVTVAHADEGWDHYADKWEILDAEGTIIATRELAHPHVDEQPFTRSLGGVQIPADLDRVIVRAHDSVHGFGGAELAVEISR